MRRYVSNRCKRLIIKKITDILSDKEQADLNEYMTSNSEAKKYFAELKRIWDETNTIVPANIFKTDVYDEWIKFIRFLNNHINMKINKVCFLYVILTLGFLSIINAQQTKIDYFEYSVIAPVNYPQEGKKYPLIVCYKGQISDSLFTIYSTNKQLIVLLFDTTYNITSNPEYQKEIILRTKNDYSVARDKIYLLGVNQNIEITIKTKQELDYYFGATAYITNNPDRYKYLKDRIKQNRNVKLYYANETNSVALDSVHQLFLQNRLWVIDIQRMSEDAKAYYSPEETNKWKISLSYGQWYFSNSAKSKNETILDFPKNMGSWNLSFVRYFSERISVNVNIGIQMKNIKPSPDYSAILNGDDIEIDAGSLTFIPLSLGFDYFFLNQKFRPYLGASIGSVFSKVKYVEASGNINDGIEQEELKLGSKAPFIEVSSGFIYRTGKNIQLGLSFDYTNSTGFSEHIGGYKSYNGLKISGVFSVLF